MTTVKHIGKALVIVLTYFILLKFSKLVMFWTYMVQVTSLEDLEHYSWIGKHGEFFFWGTYELGLPMVFVMALLMFLIFHGRDVYLGGWKRVRQISKKYWQELWIKAALTAGSVFGLMWYGIGRLETTIADRFASPGEIYHFVSGTTVFLHLPDGAGGEVAETLDWIGTIFEMNMFLGENDCINIGIVFLIYEFLRICFDKKVPLEKIEGQKGGD